MANNNQLITQGMEFGELTKEDITTIRQTLAKDCNDSQFKLFMSIAKSSGANPVMNEIYPAVRSGQLTVQFAVEYFVRKAKESPGYSGHDVQLVHDNDEFKMHQEQDEEGRYYAVIDEHSWAFPRGKVIGGYAIAYREDKKPFTVVMEVDEVEHFKKSNIGMQKTMWTNYFNDMFKKHMLRRALKAAYELNYDDEVTVGESQGSNDNDEFQRNRRDITPNQDVIEHGSQQNDNPEPQQEQKPSKIDQLKDQMRTLFTQLGITTNDGIKDYLKKHAPDANPGTQKGLIAINQLLETNLEMLQAQASNDDALD
ncbi:RecT family recombinase [Terribacillus sp. DMT04]|uniref:RecT family recombinase n=1 Tax=Terribacillus sp. DMT04 TaxID=2850441 RepID=UPI001C2B8DC5|nr:RecT family recombinase [Terribacillus sp. DMT04]QXE02797.1 recombinase RecT [Terribacillus sp. DMT04]